MNDNDFIELLESVRNDVIAYNDNDVFTVGDVIDLINRQKAEIEVLYKINAKSEEEISELLTQLLKRQNLEESFSKSAKQFDKKLARTVKLERTEAIKEFWEKVKQEFQGVKHILPTAYLIGDKIVKEMTEQTTFSKVEHNSLCETETYKGGE